MKKEILEKLKELTLNINLKYMNPFDKELFFEICFESYLENSLITKEEFISIMNLSKTNVNSKINTNKYIEKFYDEYLKLYNMFSYLNKKGYITK